MNGGADPVPVEFLYQFRVINRIFSDSLQPVKEEMIGQILMSSSDIFLAVIGMTGGKYPLSRWCKDCSFIAEE